MPATKYSGSGCQYHACWCPGSWSRQSISRHGVGYVRQATCIVIPELISSTWVKLIQNTIQNMNISFVIFKNDSARVSSRFQAVRLVKHAFHLEYHSSCNYDSVSYFYGTPHQHNFAGKYCGTTFPAEVTSSGNVLTVKFTSDRSVTKSGFHFTYSTVDAPNVGGGGGGGNEPEGEISARSNNWWGCAAGRWKLDPKRSRENGIWGQKDRIL